MNCENEFGQSPLELACMIPPLPSKKSIRWKTIKWFVKEGAFINHRDKGGYSAIDYAAMNQVHSLN